MTPERVAKIRSILDSRQTDLTVITDKINKNQNISAILRSCDAFGIHRLHTVEPDTDRTTKDFQFHHKTSGGSGQWVVREHHETSQAALDTCKAQGMKVYAAHLSDKAIHYKKVDYTQPCVIVMGAEKEGVSDVIAEQADEHIIIPMHGMVESFNVSVAAAIILNEAHSQRDAKGLFDRGTQLSQEEYHHYLFKWCHPRLAEFCDKKGIDYPPISEDGHLIEPSGWYESVRDA